jgi:competence protein ComEA
VRALLDADDPAARTQPVGGARHAASGAAGTRPWLPDEELDRRVPADPEPARGHPARVRWNPGRRSAAALGVAAVAVIAGIGWWLAAARPHAMPLSASSSLPPGSSMVPSTPSGSMSTTPSLLPSTVPASSASASAPPEMIVVDVAGRVMHPGIYRLAAGARVYDAIGAAGGPRRGVNTVSLNLAAPLQDGQQIVVGATGASAPAPVPGASPAVPGVGSSPTGAPLDVNTATLEELETLPGVGPVLGQNILDYRAANGPFATVDQLADVSGIGDVRLAELRPLVSV